MDSLKKVALGLRDRITKTPLERQISDICSDENYGTSNTLLHEVAEKTFNPEERTVIMKCTWEFVKSPPKEWRRIYKALNLVEHLLKFGSTSCVNEIRDEAFKIRLLQDFSYRENSEERGTGIRDKCKYISSLLADHRVLEEEKDKAKKLWNKFSGGSSNDGGRSNYSERDRRYEEDYNRSSYDPYPKRESERGYDPYPRSTEPDHQQQPETVYQEQGSIRNDQPKIDIFSAPAVKPVANTKLASQPGRINPPPSEGSIFDKVTIKTTQPSTYQEPVWNQPVQKPVDIWGQPSIHKAPEAFPVQKPADNFGFTQTPLQSNPLEALWSAPAPQPTYNQPLSQLDQFGNPAQYHNDNYTNPPAYNTPSFAQPTYSKQPQIRSNNPLETL